VRAAAVVVVVGTILAATLGSGNAQAQQSASFKLVEHTFNAGGRPEGGTAAASANYRITLDAIGDSVTSGPLAGNGFQVGGGFVSPYPPAGEVMNLRFSSKVSLTWNPEPSAGVYNLYRASLSTLPGAAYGTCRTSAIPGTTTNDADAVSPGSQGYFYLVTAKSLLKEEGIKGHAGNGALRPNLAPCP
jgi:hypothetical protein